MELEERMYFALFWVCPSLGSSWVFPMLSHSHGFVYFGITSVFLVFPVGGGLHEQLLHPSVRHRLSPALSVVLYLGPGTQGRGLRSQQGFALVRTLSRAQFKTSLLRASAKPSLRG